MKLTRFRAFMGSIGLLLIVTGILTMLPTTSQAQTSPDETLKTFYKWYLHELVSERYPKPTSPKVNAVISARLRNWFKSKAGREWDADYFIDAQDWDPKWETHIKTTDPVIKGNNAELRVILGPEVKAVDSMSPHTLRIKMVKEKGGWKIDHINGY